MLALALEFQLTGIVETRSEAHILFFDTFEHIVHYLYQFLRMLTVLELS